MDKRTLILSVLAFGCLCCSPDRSTKKAVRQPLLDAIRMVESSGNDNPKDGDDGKAIGPFQIHEGYWIDATDYDPSIGGTYEDCRKRAYAEKIVTAYMRRWVPEDKWTDERIARVHNGGGPSLWKSKAAGEYWKKVQQELKR